MTTEKKRKSKNPLYVVKGKNVEMASGIFDMVIKKLGLGPVIEVLQKLMAELFKNIQSYSMFLAVKKMADELIEKYIGILQKFAAV